jgi:putative addiction module component (TIGR02574 family)
MTIRALIQEAEKLSEKERWELVDELLRMEQGKRADVALTPAQAEDLRRRMEEAKAGNEELIPGDQAFEMLRKRA